MPSRILLLAAVALTGCATAMHHDLQQIPVTSTPAGASVMLDCGRGRMAVGTTPMTLYLRRRDACNVTLSKSGWQDAHVNFRRIPSPAALTNAIPAVIAGGIVANSRVDFSASNGSTSGGVVNVSASGSGSVSPAAVAGVVFSGALLIDAGSGALFEQFPTRVDIRLEPKR